MIVYPLINYILLYLGSVSNIFPVSFLSYLDFSILTYINFVSIPISIMGIPGYCTRLWFMKLCALAQIYGGSSPPALVGVYALAFITPAGVVKATTQLGPVG